MRSIFISSTFRDMQAERDVLHLQIFPELRKRLAAYGEDVQELDLRWGVDTSRMSEEKSGEFVVESCIDSIERCKPYMIVLLGSRYGWVPEQRTIDATADARVQQWYETGSSITQLEIQYGALRADIEPDRCIFCFRNEDFPDQVPQCQRSVYAPESSLHEEKLRLLKQRIRSREGARILEYNARWDETAQGPGGLEPFAAELTEAVWQILSKDLKEANSKISEEERIYSQARLTARQYLSSYVSRKVDREGVSALTGRCAHWFSGEPGSGKSAMMAKIADNGTKIGVNVFLYYGGNGGCHSANTLARTLIWWFNQMDTGEKPLPIDDYLVKNIPTLDTLLRRQRDYDYAILVDGVDQMDEDTLQLLCWMSRVMMPEDQPIKISHWHGLAVSSTVDYQQRWKEELNNSFRLQQLEPLNHVELDSIAQSQSARRGKRLDAEVMRRIRAKEQAHNPYYLSLLLQKLFMMDRKDFELAEAMAPGMKGLSLFMCKELEEVPDTPEEMTVSLLRETCDKLAARMHEYTQEQDNVVDPMIVLGLLAASREGLTLAQIDHALKLMNKTFPTMFLERLFVYLYDSFSESETGVWNFKHRLLREGLLAYIGPERAQAFSTIILAMRWEETAPSDELLYYAWKSGDVKKALITLKGYRLRSLHAPDLIQIFQTEDGAAYLTEFFRQLDSDSLCHILLELVLQRELLFRKETAAKAVLAAVLPREGSSKAHHFYYHLLRQWLEFWNYDTSAFVESWEKMLQSLPEEGDPANMSRTQLFNLCLEILGSSRYRQLWPQVRQYLEGCHPERASDKQNMDHALKWARLLLEYQAGLDTNDRKREEAALKAARDYLRDIDFYYVVVDSWRALLAELLLEKEWFQDVVDLTRERLTYLNQQFNLYGNPLVGMRLIRIYTSFLGAVKSDIAVKGFQLLVPTCRQAMQGCSGSYLKYLTCQVLIHLRKSQKQVGDNAKSHKTLELLIPELDQLTEQVGADRLPVPVLQEFLDQRYTRVNLRRTSCYLADQDQNKVSMDVMLQLIQGNYTNAPKSETRIIPWKFLREQEADFDYMEAHYPALEKRCRNYSVYIDMVYARLEQARYYDACHMEDKMIAVCNKLLNMANFMEDTKRNNLIWLSLAVRLELAELLYRYFYSKSAASLSRKAFEMMKNLDGDWVVKTNREAEFNRRVVRCYLVMAQADMRETGEDSLKSAFAFTYNAVNKLSGENGSSAMPKSCDDLRCETWLLMGQIVNKMGKDPSDILARADKYWPETTVNSALRSGGHDQLMRLLGYCRGLSLRARTLEDGELAEKAARYLCRIAMEQVQNQDASLWEPLLDELMTLCRFYWNRIGKLDTPDCLRQCMTRALYCKSLRGDLSQEEQILFASYSLVYQDPDITGGKKVPEEGYLAKALECTVALNRKQGRGTLRARLAMAKMLRGDHIGAQETAMDIFGVSSLAEIKLLSLFGVITGGMATGGPPRAPRLPMGQEWLTTPDAKQEPFIARYLEPICALLDCRIDGLSGTQAALYGLKLLKSIEKTFEKELKDTEVPKWAAEMGLRLVRGVKEDPGCVDLQEYIDAVKTAQEGSRVVYYRTKNDTDLDTCIYLTTALALEYHARQDLRRASLNGTVALQEGIKLRKQASAQSKKENLGLYRLLRTWQDERFVKATDALLLMNQGYQLLLGLFDIEKDPKWITMLHEETAWFRDFLPKCQGETESWRMEKAAESYDMDRTGCMKVLQVQQEEAWQQKYLDTVILQLDTLGEGYQSTLEAILADLWQINPLSTAIAEQRLDLVDRLTDQLRRMPDDMHYITYRAVQADVPIGGAAEYVANYRATMLKPGI